MIERQFETIVINADIYPWHDVFSLPLCLGSKIKGPCNVYHSCDPEARLSEISS